MESIKISVSGNLTSVISTAPVVAGTVGLEVEFSFDPTWGALKKTAVFRVGSKTRDVCDAGEKVIVPWELLQKPGSCLWAGVYGVNEEGNLQIPTVWTDLGVIQPGTDPSGDEGADPTLPVWEQVGKNTVKYTPQTLTPEQQAQARANIGVVSGQENISVLHGVSAFSASDDADIQFNGNLIHGIGTPKADTDAANKAYVDTAIANAIGVFPNLDEVSY